MITELGKYRRYYGGVFVFFSSSENVQLKYLVLFFGSVSMNSCGFLFFILSDFFGIPLIYHLVHRFKACKNTLLTNHSGVWSIISKRRLEIPDVQYIFRRLEKKIGK